MKKKFIYILGSVILFLVTVPVMAQTDPGTDPDAPAPIDDYLWVLATIGLVFIFMKFRALQKNKIQG